MAATDLTADRPRRAASASSEAELLARLRLGDEHAFQSLVEMHHGRMMAIARTYVKTHAVAEEVVQETWLSVLKGLRGFEGRSTLKTWILRILVNTAMLRGGREARSVPFSTLLADQEGGPAVAPERFRAPGEPFAGDWATYPNDWRSLPENRLLGRESLDVVRSAIAELPESQQRVIALRDVAGYSAEEACETLEISDANQRVLLHRARSHVRTALERHIDG